MSERIAKLEEIARWAESAVAFQLREVRRARFSMPGVPELMKAESDLFRIETLIKEVSPLPAPPKDSGS